MRYIQLKSNVMFNKKQLDLGKLQLVISEVLPLLSKAAAQL